MGVGAYLRQNLVAVVALAVALSTGTAWAVEGTITSRDIKDGTVRSVDVADGGIAAADLRKRSVRLSELDPDSFYSGDIAPDSRHGGRYSIPANAISGGEVAESSLATVPDASRLDGVDSTGFVRACRKGAVHAFVRVHGNAQLSTSSLSTTGTSVAWNCAGPAPLVREGRNGFGDPLFIVCFPNNPGIAGLGDAIYMSESSDYDNYLTWQVSTRSDENCPGDVYFVVRVIDDNGDLEKAPFFFALL